MLFNSRLCIHLGSGEGEQNYCKLLTTECIKELYSREIIVYFNSRHTVEKWREGEKIVGINKGIVFRGIYQKKGNPETKLKNNFPLSLEHQYYLL